MKDHLENAVVRGFRAALAAVLALALALPVGGLTTLSAFADEPAQNAAEATPGDADGNAAGDADIKIAVLSDTHYYPLNYVSDCEDYETYVGGDPKMLEESGSILDAALQMVREDAPDILVVSGDLTKDGEKLGHEQLAERFQAIEDETDTEVFVINGNHDVFNYEDSCTFENGSKEYAETTTADDFRKIYANFGYNGDCEAEYFTNPNHDAGEIAGELSYTVDLGKFTIVAVDSGRYSPDADTGYSENEHITAGRVDDDLLPWVVEKIQAADAEGDTVIGLMHHGLVPHFEGEENILSEYVVDNWQATATAFADAGMRYIFTGHMHANDIAQFTSNAGNTITDLETGSLSSWRSPQRTVTLTKGAALDDGTQRTHEEFSVSSRGVSSIDFKDHTGNVTHIEDFQSYTQDKLYPETLFNNMANGMLRPILEEIGQTGLRAWLAENLPDVDIDAMVQGLVRDALAGGMDIELGTGVGRVHVEYRNGGIQLSPSGTAGLIGDATVTDAQILRLVDDVLDTIETKYIDDPDWLLGEVDKIVTQVSQMGVTSLNAEQHSIYDLVLVVLTGHYAGHENPPAWVDDALAYIKSGDVVQTLITTLIDDLMPIIDTLLADNSIDTGIAFSGLWKTVIDSATDDGNLKSTLELFGFDSAAIRGMIEGLVNEYMSPSFLTGMGSLISEIAGSMLYDSNFTDDVIDGEGVTITFDGTVTPPEPSVDNGLLPTQVTMTLGSSSGTDRNFRWYTGTNVTSGTVQVATDADFQNIVAEAQAISEQVTKPKTQLNLGLVTTYGTQQAERHSASVTGLDDGASYYYRVGDKENGWWSDAFPFSTGDAADADDTFTFINVNDSQGMVESDYDVYKNTLAAADAAFPTASFTVHGGDFVDDGANEDYWTWALDDANGVAQGMSMTPAAGNHEAKSDVEGITDANPIVSHFNLANVPAGQDLSSGVYYSYVYKNATFVVLNTNDLAADESLSQAQYDWAYDTLANAGTQWKIVLMHKSPYSNGPHQSDSDVAAIRSQIDALAAACDVDLVLSGHDHVYNRTPFLSRGEAQDVAKETQTYEGQNYETALNPNGTAFVIAGTAGVKNYVQTPSADIPSEVALDLAVPVYSGITIDGDHLYYQAYKVEGGTSALVDSFAISKAEEDAPAWKQVEDLIAALPEQSKVTVDDEAAITEARAAYDALSAEDQAQVSNYDRLTAAEHMLSVLKGVAGKRTVTVSNADDFANAVKDPSVGTILTTGSFEFDEGGLFDDGNREIYVDRDLVVGGSGELKFCRFHVRNSATLVLKDSVYVNDTRSQGSFYDALNPVEVNAGGTLITQDSVSLRTEYGTGGSDEGIAVKLMGSGATAILGSNGTYWGSEAAVLSTVSGTTLVINDGTYNAKNNNRVVIDTHGDATVNGGTISSMWISGTLRVNGGTFEHQDSASSNWTPLAVSGGNAYITGGTFSAFNGRDGNASIKLENNAKLHVLADTNGAVNIGSATPYVGSPSTSDYKNVKLGYVKSNGWNSSDGVYRVEGSVSASSVEDIAGLSASRLDTKDVANNGNYMETVLPDGTSTVYGKYWIYGGNGGKGAPSGSGIIGSGDVIVYGPTRTIQNNPVTGVTIDGDDRRVVDLREEGAGTLRLNGYTTPADAFDNGITWSSNNEQTASVEAVAGQGVVSLKIPGGATITATSVSKPDLSDSVEIIAVEPKFVDTVEEIAWNQEEAIVEASAGFSNDTYKKRISFKYSTDNNSIATFEPEVDPETGEAVSELQPGTLRKISRGTVKVTAELLVDGKPTGITVSKDVFRDAAPEAPTYGELAELLDVTVADGNEAMAAEHAAQTFDLIENASEQTDSYSVGKVSAVEKAPGSLGEALANLTGLAKAGANWNVDVTVYADAYVKAFDDNHNMAEGTHAYDGDLNKRKTVKLVWSEGDDQADPAVEAGWKLEKENDSPVQFNVKCTSYQVDFKYVGEDWASITAPEPVNVLAGAKIGNKLPTPEREGFTFVGWYKDWNETDGFKDENLVTSASTVGADTTLYGRWAIGAQAMSAYVVFDPSGGAFAEDDETPKVVQVELTSGVDHVDTEDVPAVPSLVNHVFAGWYYKAVSEDVPDGAELPFDANVTEIVGNLHVYAKWDEKPQVEIAAGDNDFTYNGEAQAFRFSVKSDGVDAGSFTVKYRPADSDGDWSSQTVPTDAGEYDVRITRDEDADYASFEQVIESAVKIGKASQAMPELAVQGGAESAIIKVSGDAANGFEWDDNERFESAADVSDGAVTAAGPGTYFVRAKEANNHAAGAIAQVSVVKVDFSAGEGSLPETTHNAWLIGAGQAVGEDGMPADPTREGYGFTGWKMGEADFDAETVVNQSVSVDATWTAKTFTVNFDADGGAFEGNEGDPITVTYDQNWPELPTPTKAGMNFNGWLLGEGEDAVRIISGTPVKITGNATLKAQWTDKVAIVVTVGQENEFVYDGVEHSFSYTTDPEGVEMTVEYRPAASESDEDWSPALPVDAGAYDVRLTHVEDETYAEFSAAIGHVLVIDKADQTLPEQFFSASTFGDYVLVTFSSADMVGNLEWANNEGFVDAAEVTQGDTFEVRSEGAYYLRLKGDANHNPSPSASFTVVKATFDVGEGVLSQGDKAAWLIQSGTTLGGNLPEASREGYRFDGWFAGETQIGAETQINDSIAAAAKWTANTYQLAFDADGDGQADDDITPMTVTYDSAYGELPVPAAQAGKIFEGWLLNGAVVSAEDTVKITENTLLTAKWTDKREIAVLPDADVNKAYVYGDEGIVFEFDATEGTMPERFEILYGDAEQNTWDGAAPVNAGTYDVKVTYAEDEAFKAFERVFDDALIIAKADQTMSELSVTAGSDGATVSFEPAEGAGYERADNAEFDDAQPVEGGTFQATEPGTWYVRAKGDANHNVSAAQSVQIAKVTFDAASGIVEGSVAWFLKSGESVGEGNLPTATREGFEFAGWTVDGEPFDGTTPAIGDIIAIAGWSEVGDEPGPDEPQAPAAPVADEVATLEGVTVTLNGVNEINSDEGNKTHPDVTFASVGEDVQPLIAKSFTIGQPAETDGVWTVEVTMDAQKYLDAYAAMGDPAYGAHYFANADEDGVETFALTYDADARAWVLANAQQAAFAYDITCLTLRPAEAEIYTGGTSENGGHFIDQYVVDGRGNVVSIDELNERLDEGVTASIKYYDADGNEVTDDTVAGHYIARIDVSAAEEQARAAAIDDTVEVNVGGREYTFNLEPSELVIRSVSDAAEAERGDLNVALVDGSDAQAVATALGQAQGGVVAALPGETTILFNGNPEVEIADRSDITLLSDDLLPGGREDALLARVQEVLGAEALADNTDFQYLDLVDRSQSNAWVSSTAGTQVFWRIPEGADTGSIKILHFVDLHRDYTMADEDVVDLIAGCDVEAMSLTFDEENGFVSFAVPEGGFSPFLMTWNDAVDDPDQPGTDPDQPGTDPDDPGTDPDQPAQKVTVTFDANGGQLSTGTPGSVEIAAGGTIAMLPRPVRTGYAFVGWTAADGTAFDITTPVNESMTVIAQWTPNVYQISLDAQGGALAADEASIEATFDAPIGQLPVPTREGYEFLGWFTQPQGGDEVAAETMYRTAGPSTYYAQWDVLPATQVVLTLDANGGMFQGGQETIAEVVAINAPLHNSDLTVPQREGFELAGWYLDESLTQPVVLVEDADPDAGIVATTFAQDATLYAKWLEDLSSDADISFGGILQAYTGSAMPAVPAFGESFPNDERAKVQVLYRASLMRANEWTDQAPVNVGTYDVRFVYEGSGECAAFAKDYPAGITITKATLAQVGLTVDTSEVEAGTKLADVSLEGATVTSQVTGAVIEGIWAWLDADGVVDETGAYQAVFVPADAENFEPLHVEIQLTVKEAGADEPGGSDKPTEPTDPGLPGTDSTDPDNQPGAGTGTDTGSGSGTGAGTGAGTGSGSDGADGRNQMKLVATGDPVAGMIVGFGAVLLAALITGLVALRNTRRKN